MSFYELQTPTSWAAPPSTWSTTSIEDVDTCPRRWQLLRSQWGEYERFPVRSSPAAIEGQIIHEALDRLTRACGRSGNPAFGSDGFAAALEDADFFGGMKRDLAEWQQRIALHPRPGPVFQLRVSAEELINRAVRMFREQYKSENRPAPSSVAREIEATADLNASLLQRGALSEVKLFHPQLPFMGILDLVQRTAAGVEIVDFKTGKPNEKHYRQLLRYAVLWLRRTGEMPIRVSAQYLDGAKSWPVSQDAIHEAESELASKVPLLVEALRTRPASAKAGPVCKVCRVRARCDVGWKAFAERPTADGGGDAELAVVSKPGEHGFLCRSTSGSEIAVVYEAGVAKLLPSLAEGQAIRVLDGAWKENRSTLELKAWTEVFVLHREG